MNKTNAYPTWVKLDRNNIVSREQLDGIPDFHIARDKPTKQWWVKWRTSACWTRGFTTAADAIAYVEHGRRSHAV